MIGCASWVSPPGEFPRSSYSTRTMSKSLKERAEHELRRGLPVVTRILPNIEQSTATCPQ